MKKKIFITLLTTALALCCALCFGACNSGKTTIYYSEIKKNGEVIAYSVIGSSKRKNIEIPATYNDKPVTAIGDGAFNEGAFLFLHLESITIPDSVTEIGVDAFRGCRYLTAINFNGTQKQWGDIDKGINWNGSVGIHNGIGYYKINCTDGEIKEEVNDL